MVGTRQPQVCWKMTGSAPGLTYSVAPFFEREQDGPKGLPGVSQEVLVAWADAANIAGARSRLLVRAAVR